MKDPKDHLLPHPQTQTPEPTLGILEMGSTHISLSQFPLSVGRASPRLSPHCIQPLSGWLVQHQPAPTPPLFGKQAGNACCMTLGCEVQRLQSQSESLPP